jgi:hypothetical protein
MMTFDRHTPIISYHIDTIFLNLPRGKIPVAWEADIGLLNLHAINIKLPGTKFNLFTLSGDHTF